jgi:hypothetical protein
MSSRGGSSSSKRRRSPEVKRWIPFAGLGVLGIAAVGLAGIAITDNRVPAEAGNVAAPVTVSPTPTAEEAASLAEQLAGDEPVQIVVVGDSTGYQDMQWVMTMAADLSNQYNRSTGVPRWNKDTLTYDPAVEVGNGSGAPLTIWNGSATGQPPAYSSANLTALIPIPDPALIIVNHGHNTGPDPVLDIKRLTDNITAGFPDTRLAVTVQNPNTVASPEQYAATASLIQTWLATQSGWTTIDAYAAFMAQPNPKSLYQDARHPNAAGGRLWADVAKAALGI